MAERHRTQVDGHQVPHPRESLVGSESVSVLMSRDEDIKANQPEHHNAVFTRWPACTKEQQGREDRNQIVRMSEYKARSGDRQNQEVRHQDRSTDKQLLHLFPQEQEPANYMP